MQRRRLLQGLAASALTAGAPGFTKAHTPYRQWMVYRKKHLLIGCHRENLTTWELAEDIAALLETELPDARARVARAKTRGRLASLLGTDQLDTAILATDVSVAMAKGTGDFTPYGEIDLRTVAVLGDYTLVARAEMLDEHVALLEHAVSKFPQFTPLDHHSPAPGVVWHPGVLLSAH